MSTKAEAETTPLDKVLFSIGAAIRQYQKEQQGVRSYRIRQGHPQTGNQESIAIPDIDPHQPMHVACVVALTTFNHPVHVKELQPILRKLYNRRITPNQIYMALEYRRRRQQDVGRGRGGLWFIQGPKPVTPPADPATIPPLAH